jgi:hypothetical protein
MESKGQVVRSEVTGAVIMKSFLQGNPEVKLSFNEPLTESETQTPFHYKVNDFL